MRTWVFSPDPLGDFTIEVDITHEEAFHIGIKVEPASDPATDRQHTSLSSVRYTHITATDKALDPALEIGFAVDFTHNMGLDVVVALEPCRLLGKAKTILVLAFHGDGDSAVTRYLAVEQPLYLGRRLL